MLRRQEEADMFRSLLRNKKDQHVVLTDQAGEPRGTATHVSGTSPRTGQRLVISELGKEIMRVYVLNDNGKSPGGATYTRDPSHRYEEEQVLRIGEVVPR